MQEQNFEYLDLSQSITEFFQPKDTIKIIKLFIYQLEVQCMKIVHSGGPSA